MLLTSVSLVLLFRTAAASYQNLSQPFDPHHTLARRAYSVPLLHSPSDYESLREGGFGPWPITHPGVKVAMLRYCFKDERSYKNLDPIVSLASGKWQEALYPHSGLNFGFEAHDAHLCSDRGVQPDTLIISDETIDDDDMYNRSPKCDTSTKSTGYDYRHGIPGQPGRHTLKFCKLMPNDGGHSKDRAVLSMAHELGHAMGLHHEHQRPDSRDYIEFVCENLDGFEEAMELIRTTNENARVFNYPEDVSGEENRKNWEMLKGAFAKGICTEEAFAKPYFPAAIQFITGDKQHNQEDKWEASIAGGPFDYESIMIYDSTTGAKHGDPKKPKTWVIYRKDNGKPVWTGGNKNPYEAKISGIDVARVKYLYPPMDEHR